jgi:hypothetical protein
MALLILLSPSARRFFKPVSGDVPQFEFLPKLLDRSLHLSRKEVKLPLSYSPNEWAQALRAKPRV